MQPKEPEKEGLASGQGGAVGLTAGRSAPVAAPGRGAAPAEADRSGAVTLAAILDAIPAHIALLDPQGVIVAVNESWKRFATANALQSPTLGVGNNYLAVCERATGECAAEAAAIGQGLRRVIAGELPEFSLEYPCHSPGEQRWFRMMITPVSLERRAGAVVTHINITERRRAEEALAVKTEILASVTESLGAYVERGDWREAMGRLLRCALSQTVSEYGFIGVVVGASSLRVLAHEGIVWDKILNREFYEEALRRYEAVGYLEFTSFNNLFGRAITTGQVVMANRPAHDSRSGGLPKGHPPMHSFLGVPIFAGPQVQGVVALANRPGGYSAEDQRRIEILVQHAGGLCISYRQNLTARALEEERKRAEEALRASESEQRALVEKLAEERARLVAAQSVAKVGSWETDLETFAVNWSPETYRIFEVDPAEFQPTHERFLALVHPDDRAVVDSAFRRSFVTGETQAIDHRVRPAGGRSKVVEERWQILCDETGRPRRALGTCRDITGEKQATAALRASEEEFRQLTEALPQIVWVTRPDGWHIHFNKRWMEYTGLTLEESLGHGWNPPFHPEDRPRAAERWKVATETGQPYEIEYRLRRADGVYRWMLGRALPLRDATGAIIKWFGTCTDIEDFKVSQSRVAEQAALLDQAHDAIIVRDPQHHIVYWNKAAERLYGWTAAEALGRRLHELLMVDAVKFEEADRAVRAAGVWNGEIQKTAKDGRLVTAEVSWTLLRDNQGRPRTILTIDTDITERKKLEQQFLRAQRMESIGTLAGGIAHDLNNLLAPITMGVELLRRGEPDPRSQQVIESIERSARRGAELVKQVLSFARGVEGSRVPLQVRHVMQEIESIVANTFPKNIVFEADLPRDLWLVLADPTQVSQVLLNLCVNARDALPDGGRLTVRAANIEVDEQYAVMNRGIAAGRYVVIEVIDNGCGIPREIIDRIFEPFFTTKEHGKGTGLGLSTALGIVRSHGGGVSVYSEVGKGSTFKVYLPAHADAAPANTATPFEEKFPRGEGELVLVVDDEASIRQVTQQTLEAFGYKVLVAEDGAQAVGVYATHREEVALVLTDMMMPVMDGPALIMALRRINPQVRIIAASGLNANGNVARAAHAGVKHFLPKPYSADAMLGLIHQVLGGTGSRPL